MSGSAEHNGLGSTPDVSDRVRAPLYRAWLDVWTYRIGGRHPDGCVQNVGVGVLWALAFSMCFWAGRTRESIFLAVACIVAAAAFSGWLRGRQIRREFRTALGRWDLSREEIDEQRADWARYLASLRLSPRETRRRTRVHPSGLWPIDVMIYAGVGCVLVAGVTRMSIFPSWLPFWAWVAALLAVVCSRWLIFAAVRSRRLRSLEAACASGTCCWCGYGIGMFREGEAYPARCPECGLAGPCVPPSLPRAGGGA